MSLNKIYKRNVFLAIPKILGILNDGKLCLIAQINLPITEKLDSMVRKIP